MTVGGYAPQALGTRQERRLEEVAAALVGGPVRVRCQTSLGALVDAGSELGSVRYGADGRLERATLLKRAQCLYLAQYLRSDKRNPSSGQVAAVHVLTHESMHMRGISAEPAAECAAVQRDATAARLLGAPAAASAQLAVSYWREHYPYLPESYRSGACRADGALDEQLPDAPW